MYRVPVAFPPPGRLKIYISQKVSYHMSERQQRFAYLPDPQRLIYDLNNLSRQGGVPAIVYHNQNKATSELQLYTDKHYYLVLHERSSQEGYNLGYIEPLGLREQERMSKGVLLLQPQSWEWCSEPRQLQGYFSYWKHITYAWNSLDNWRRQARAAAGEQGMTGLTADQDNYLSTIQMLVDLEHRLELDQYQLAQQILYHKVVATGEKRYARDIYTFLLHGSPTINEKNMLRIVEERELQARVLSYKGNRLTLKFERAVDLDHIPPTGSFEPIISGAIYRTQQEALVTLREGEAKNPHLLRVLVDHQFQGYVPSTQLPEKSLNQAQREAFQRALNLPDLLCVWGPPGTGKSRTITEIARQYSQQGKRVLITSGTHKAVDNVLEQFLADKRLMVVRFGHEDRILETVRAKLTIDEQTKEMKQQILKRTAPQTRQFQAFLQQKQGLDNRLGLAKSLLAQWHTNQQRLPELRQLLAYASRSIEGQYQPRIQQLAARLKDLEIQLQRQMQQQNLWQQKQQRAAQKIGQPLLGFFYRWRLNSLQKRLALLATTIVETRRNGAATDREHQAALQQLQDVLNQYPEYRQRANALATINAECVRLLEQARNHAWELSQQSDGLLSPFAGETTGPALLRHFSQLQESATTLEKRAHLLRDWQSELETSAEQLTPEVLRYADIVGATCIGVATAKGLTDIDFDLVIVDEAGQISTPNLLVPLVRARRAILVGDHQQLPPFVDSNVQTWIKNLSPQTLQELGLDDDEFDGSWLLSLFTKSAFEHLLLSQLRRENLVMFTEQRRMPGVIADFSSQHFYSRLLTTVRGDRSFTRDTLFRSELAFVDTSTVSSRERKEIKQRQTEEWGNPGFTNPCEARLIAQLAARYEQKKFEWGIIVPYRAQAGLIISQLEKLIEAPDFRWDERVATVDSFQGGERDYILYSFTRSNPYGGVGFLSEQRRFNVALTRAKQQLVLVGDLSTLTNANDADFRTLMHSLQNYATSNGELLTYQECQRRLG